MGLISLPSSAASAAGGMKKPPIPHPRVSFGSSFTKTFLRGALYFSAGARQNSGRTVRLDSSACATSARKGSSDSKTRNPSSAVILHPVAYDGIQTAYRGNR
jgi:hypothetical protein